MRHIGTFKGYDVYKADMDEYLRKCMNKDIVFWLSEEDRQPLVKDCKVIGYYDGNTVQEVKNPMTYRYAVSAPRNAEGLEARDKQVYSSETAEDYKEYSKIVDKFFEELWSK